ncbi:MAG: DUF5119 domain-containing protein [Paramuribaculum sp.]|nr:DUF5119 domain-containing protein [Paramuribaculum sp.]MDE6303883.1 DUF5119 domain-containing protein [Paramuribaculum sp.]
MRTSVIFQLLTAALALTLGSCEHKELCYDHSVRRNVYVEFDWSKAPDADPASMLVYFFPTSGDALAYTFTGRSGGQIALPLGRYCALTINGDMSERMNTRHTEDPDIFEVFTKDATQLSGGGFDARLLPRASGEESERMALTPDMIWSIRNDSIEMRDDDEGDKYIIFMPEEAVCHYTVDILDVKNLDYLHGASVDATISGMAEGYLNGHGNATDNTVTMPFTLKPSTGNESLHSEFLTFGECNTNKVSHRITVYLRLTDGTKWYHTFDVTDQVADAPDPRHVNIVIRGLELPQPVSGGGGFIPDVNKWNDIEINLPMWQ